MQRSLVVGDLHGCAQELDELLRLARPTRLYLLGDLFTRGPEPRRCWELLREHRGLPVLGNHDEALLRAAERLERGEELPPEERYEPVLRALRELRAVPEALDWLRRQPLFRLGPRWTLVHAGVHPFRGVGGTTRRQALELRRWPDERPGAPFWWELYRPPPGAPLLLYGHDALRGLQDHRPRSLGLDGGCVYGGSLWGYLLEEDRLLRVPARRAWYAP